MNMTEKELLKAAAEEYNEKILDEIKQLDKEINDLNLRVPREITDKIEKETGLKLNVREQKRLKNIYYKIAAVILMFTAGVMGVSIGYPIIITAVKNAKLYIEFNNKKGNVDIVFSESGRIKYQFSIPEGYELDSSTEDTKFIRHIYTNTNEPDKQNKYITICCYTSEYNIFHDNEDCDIYGDIDVNGNAGKLFIKNGITTIIFTYNNNLIEVSSNLPEKDVQAIAESIKE